MSTRAKLNDHLRSTFTGGKVVMTNGVACLDEFTLVRLKNLVRSFSEFSEDNDPFGEHDFGSVTLNGVNYFWKIDYYDKELEYMSPDPNDPDVTTRVLTILRADEY